MDKEGHVILECCTDSVESALAAKEGGADRIELCSGLVIGGLSPSPALYEAIREACDIRIHVLLRPRFGDFCYSEYECGVIKREVEQFREAGADGVVIGMLCPDGALDVRRMEALVKLAGNMSVTLHRAFDMCREPQEALRQAKELGIHTILTSGQRGSVMEGADLLRSLIKETGETIDIMPGGGVTAENIASLYEATAARAFHMSGKKVIDSAMKYRKEGVSMGLPSMSEYDIWQTDVSAVRKAREALDACTVRAE